MRRLKGRFSTPYDPLDSKRMLWINQHMDYAGDDCLMWPYGRGQNGYAIAGVAPKVFYVHRFMCEHRNGLPPTPQHHAAHSCGTEGCVNPRHLDWKTNAENQLDRRKHGTHKNGQRWKLTPEQVAEIKALRGVEPMASLAARFKIKDSTIRQIYSGRIWRSGKREVGGFAKRRAEA